MKKYKILIVTLIVFLLSSFFTFAKDGIIEPTEAFYTADYTEILSSQLEEFIISTNLNYEKTQEKPQVVVATVENLNGLDIREYTVKLFEKWKIGNAKYDNGVLVLISLEERKIRIEVGYGLEGALPDGKVGNILDSANKYLTQDEFDDAIGSIFVGLTQEINNEYDYDDEKIYSSNAISSEYIANDKYDVPLVYKVIAIALLLLLLWLDYRFAQGFFAGIILNILFRGIFNSGHGGSSGMGGSSGGGGSERDF